MDQPVLAAIFAFDAERGAEGTEQKCFRGSSSFLCGLCAPLYALCVEGGVASHSGGADSIFVLLASPRGEKHPPRR
jgi:hypothetical protein